MKRHTNRRSTQLRLEQIWLGAISSCLVTMLLVSACTGVSGTSTSSASPTVASTTKQPILGIAMYRANPQRTGEYAAKGVPQFHDLAWKYHAGGLLSPPIVAGGLVYLEETGAGLHILDQKTGNEVRHLSEYGAPDPVVDGVSYYQWKDLFAVDMQTHQEKWRFKPGSSAIIYSPALVDDSIFAGSEDGYVYAIDKNTGRSKWAFKASDTTVSPPAVGNGLVYIDGATYVQQTADTASYDSTLYALDMKTGGLEWAFHPGASVGSPLAGQGVVYCTDGFGPASREGYVYEIDSATGKELWRYKPTGGAEARLAMADGTLYVVGSSNNLVAIDANTRQERWTFQADSFISDTPSIADGVIYFGTGDRYLHALDAKIGRELWKFMTEGVARTPPIVSEDALYFTDDQWNLYALK